MIKTITEQAYNDPIIQTKIKQVYFEVQERWDQNFYVIFDWAICNPQLDGFFGVIEKYIARYNPKTIKEDNSVI